MPAFLGVDIGGTAALITLHASIKPALQAALPHAVISLSQIDAATHAAQWARQTTQPNETTP